jgi:hypothetical protein
MPKTSAVERMEFTLCPYDGSEIELEADWRGPALLSCSVCGAAWEWHNAWLRRVREPDREAVRAAMAGREPGRVVRGGREPAFVATMWRRARSSSSSSQDSNPTAPTA